MKVYILPLLSFALLAAPAPVMGQSSSEITLATCEADRAAQYAEAARNRDQTIQDYEAELRVTTDDALAAQYAEGIERAWDTEEEYRNYAVMSFRDCTRHVNSLKK